MSGDKYSVEGGLRVTHVTGTDKDGNKVSLFIKGYMEWPVKRATE